MAETKLNLNYQVNTTQFDDKVGDAVKTGGAADEVQDKIDLKFNPSGPTGGHTHDGSVGDGQKIDYTHLTSVPTSFKPIPHTHQFLDITDDIAWSQIDSLISGTGSAETIIRSDDDRLSDSRDPNLHSHPFTDITGDIAFTQLDAIVSTGSESNRIIAADDTRLADARTPISHDNTYHSETYITSAGVTYENLDNNGDVGTTSSQVSRGDHNHNTLYYVQATVDGLLLGKANTLHTHSNGDILAGALADAVSYINPQRRYYSFSPFGFGGWTIIGDGTASVNPNTASNGDYVISCSIMPDDSVMKEFSLYINTTGVHDLTISLMRTDIVNGSADTVAQITHNSSTAGYEKLTTSDFSTGMDLIDKEVYHYWILFQEDSTFDVDINITGGFIACDVEKPIP